MPPIPMKEAVTILPLTHEEAGAMALAEVEQFLALLETLEGADWERPTACTLWNVRQMVAHQVGAYAGYTNWQEFVWQFSAPQREEHPLFIDAVNERQVEDRKEIAPEALIAEFRELAPQAIAIRQTLPLTMRMLLFPPPLYPYTVGYITDLIYTRDTWMHRVDICQATGREVVLSPTHDGRIVALVVLDLVQKFAAMGKTLAFSLKLTGPAGGTWLIGKPTYPTITTIRLDTLDFNLLASGRITPEQAFERTHIEGDRAIAVEVFENALLPY